MVIMQRYAGIPVFLLISGIAIASFPVYAEPNQVLRLLEKMTVAEHTLNYEGTFIYGHGNRTATMQIVHSFDKNGERERLSSLTGEPKEIVRDDKHVFCVLPAVRSVLVESRDIAAIARTSFPAGTGDATYYKFNLRGTERIADYPCQIVEISPQDKYRYGYRLCIEDKTGLLLKSQTFDAEGLPREQMVFTDLRLRDQISTESLQTTLHEKDFAILQSKASLGKPLEVTANPAWRLSKTPPGFLITRNESRQIAGSKHPVQHIVLHDGIASVSVFIARPAGDEPYSSRGVTRSGALSAFSKMHDDFLVTVIGEVPGHTVEMIAQSLHYQTTAGR